MKRQVFFNCNHLGVTPVSVAVHSLLRSADTTSPLAIHIVHDEGFMANGGREAVRSVVARHPFASVRFALFEPFFAPYAELLASQNNGWSFMVWAWCFCTEIFPDLTGNLVFIDWDMFVMKDLRELYALDLSRGNFISAAVSESARSHRPELLSAGWREACGNTVTTAMQVIDTDAFRREHVREHLFAWYAQHKDVARCVEQDCLSVVYGDRVMRLPPKFNLPVSWLARLVKDDFTREEWRVFSSRDVLEAMSDPTIIHFIGGNKPWKYNHRPWRNTYRRAMSDLGLCGETLPGETPFRRFVTGPFFDLYNALLLHRAKRLFRLRTKR